MAFSTWAALYSEMLDDLAGRKWATKSYQIRDVQKQFSSFQEFKQVLDYVKSMADVESGEAVGRTYAKQGGGGRW